MKSKKPNTRNYVAKYAREFNRAVVHVDRKKEAKKKGHIIVK